MGPGRWGQRAEDEVGLYCNRLIHDVYYIFPTRFCWLSIRQFSGLLFFSVVLLTTSLYKRIPQQIINNSVHSPLQESSNGISSINHKLLQYYNDSLDIQPVLNGSRITPLKGPNDRIKVDTTRSTNSGVGDHVLYEEQNRSSVKQPSSDLFTTDSSSATQLSDASTRSTKTSASLKHHNVAGKAPSIPYSQNEDLDNNHDSHTHFENGKDTQSVHAHCDVSGIKSWNKGIITELHPRIQANCEIMRNNDRQEIERVKKEIKSWKSSESEEEWIESLSDCEKVVQEFSNNFYNSPEEIDFPLAYILVVYTNPQQMVRFIKALWRPQNIFCIHPDAKQSEEFIGIFRQLSKCLDNLFLPRKLEKVFYQHHTIIDSQLNCYEDLLHYPMNQWKYAINLCGRELPLKTNREMVKSLKKLKGGSAIETKHVQLKGFNRFTWKAAENYTSGKMFYTHTRLSPSPLPIYKSSNYIAVSRPFVNFFVNDKKAVEFRNYLKDVKTPEEEFYASLIHLPGVPGGSPPRGVPIPTIDKAIWTKKELCEGRMVHFVCIVSVGDLKHIYQWGVNTQPPAFFFNKYFMEDDHVVMDCMEERLLLQNIKEYETDCKHKPG